MATVRMMARYKLLALVLVAALLGAFGALQLASAASARGGGGSTVKIHRGAPEPRPITKDYSHVCTFHVHALFFRPGQTLTFVIQSWPPTGNRTVVLSGMIRIGANGSGRAPSTGAYSLPNGHYKLFVTMPNGRVKQKVFWVACAPVTTTTVCPTTTTRATTTTGATTTTTMAPTTTTMAPTTTTMAPTATTMAPTTTTAATTTTRAPTTTTAA